MDEANIKLTTQLFKGKTKLSREGKTPEIKEMGRGEKPSLILDMTALEGISIGL